MNNFYKNKKRGQALILAILFFLFIMTTLVLGAVTPILNQVKISGDVIRARESLYVAEAGMEDVFYRIKNAMDVASQETLDVAGFIATTDITDTVSGKTIVAEGDRSGIKRSIETKLVTGVGVSFNYGIQTGNGGFVLTNNAGVNGNVYSNGSILGASNTFITGSAFAANSVALSADQVNDTPATPTSGVTFGDASATQDFAQSFNVSASAPLNKVSLHLKKVGSPSNITVKIVADNAGNPSTTVLASATLSASLVTTSYAWIDVSSFNSNPLLVSGTTYWVVLDGSTGNSTRKYTIGANNTYANGVGKVGQFSSTWSNTFPSGLDGYFKVYVGGLNSVIDSIVVGSGGVGDANAHTVTNSNISGNLYCQTGSGNNKACNTTFGDPIPQGFPVSQANIDTWKEEAEAGGTISGNHTISGGSFGPKKITGNLTVTGDFTLSGTVYVVGTISLGNNVDVQLASSYGTGSGVILSDGRISISNNVTFAGSGQAGSYAMLLTTSDCPASVSCSGAYALDISNNAGTIILNAQNGTARLSNNAGAKEITAYKLYLDNNAVVTYESGLTNVNFTTGPSGGFSISSWKEVE